MDLEKVVDCPPMVWLTGVSAPGFLLGWIRHDVSGEWHAIVVWIRVTGQDRPHHQKLLITSAAHGVKPMEGAHAYRHVPRLALRRDGTVEKLTVEKLSTGRAEPAELTDRPGKQNAGLAEPPGRVR